MINRLLRCLLGKFEKAVYDAAVKNGMHVNQFFSRDYPDFTVKVNGVSVKVENNRIAVGNTNGNTTIDGNEILYIMLKRLHKANTKAKVRAKKVAEYQAALDAITKNKSE